MEKDKGEIISVIPFLMLAVITFFLLFYASLKFNLLRTSRNNLEDTLTISNLAVLIVDKEKYFNSVTELTAYTSQDEAYKKAELYIDPIKAYETFRTCFEYNLELDNDWNLNDSAIKSVGLDEMIIYNVSPYYDTTTNTIKQSIEVSEFGDDGITNQYTVSSDDNLYSPNGKLITETCSYIRVNIMVNTIDNKFIPKLYDSIVQLNRNDI